MTNNNSYIYQSKPTGLRYAIFTILACLILLTSQRGMAQLSTATMFGSVTDSSGAVVPGASIVFTQTQTNFTRETKTNGQGEYRAEFLPIGPYTIKVNAPGFKEISRAGVVL